MTACVGAASIALQFAAADRCPAQGFAWLRDLGSGAREAGETQLGWEGSYWTQVITQVNEWQAPEVLMRPPFWEP